MTGGKYDIGVSSFTINPDRKKQVNMVSYYNAGTQWIVAKGNPEKVSIDDACGKSVGVQKGTVAGRGPCRAQQEVHRRRQARHHAGHPDRPGPGRPPTSPAARRTPCSPTRRSGCTPSSRPARSRRSASIYDSAPYGYVVPKDQTDFANLLVDALKAAKADGSYEAVLDEVGRRGRRDRQLRRQPLSAMTDATTTGRAASTPYRSAHPGRWVAIAVILVLVGDVRQLFADQPGAGTGLHLRDHAADAGAARASARAPCSATVGSMVVGIVGGVDPRHHAPLAEPGAVAASRGVYTWFFRGVPRYVLLDDDRQRRSASSSTRRPQPRRPVRLADHASCSGCRATSRFLTLNVNQFFARCSAASSASGSPRRPTWPRSPGPASCRSTRARARRPQAIGMNRAQAMRRVILPQAMRVIVPPTGNETIAMLKDTSLLIAIPLGDELFFQLSAIGSAPTAPSRCSWPR